MKLVHIKVVPEQREGRPHVVMNDKIVAVCEDGTELDISSSVNSWKLISDVGQARLLELKIICSVVETSMVGADVVEPS